MVWLTVLLAVNLQTSFMPFGIALYNLRSVAPRSVTTAEIYLGAVPFLLIQMIMVVVLVLAPGIVAEKLAPPPDVSHTRIELPPTN